tara:strand:+ start:306 stop:422 length:117 start_codon:yes stop_codon:yes gene_type:complete
MDMPALELVRQKTYEPESTITEIRLEPEQEEIEHHSMR